VICPSCLSLVLGPRCREHPHEDPLDPTRDAVAEWIESERSRLQREQQQRRTTWAALAASVVVLPVGVALAAFHPVVLALPVLALLGLLRGQALADDRRMSG
jgi:hypothetical protein